MNPNPNPIWSLAVTFGLMSLFAVGGANAAIPEMHRVAVEVETTHRATPAILTLSRDPPAGENRRCRNGDDDRCAREYGLHPIARPGQR